MEKIYLTGQQESAEIEAGSRVFYATFSPAPGEGYVTIYALDITAANQAMAEASLARERALEASRVKSEFLANMSHELRTPLNGVLGLAELLASTKLDGEQRAYIDDLLLSGRRLFELIGDVLDFSRIELDRVNQLVARRLLEKQGHSVSVVGDGEQAIEALAKERFDVVLMDVQMPVLDGLSATRRIRQIESLNGERVPIIALTAHAVERDRARCLAAGMDEYLSKPIRTRDLYTALARISAKRDGQLTTDRKR